MRGLKEAWVWYSTPDSIRDGKISVLAVVEVILSVIVYWWIAVAFDTHLHLLASLVAAPLVLLRSEASVAVAQRMWDRYIGAPDVPAASFKGLSIIALTAGASFACAYFLATHWLVEFEGWPLFWRAMLLGWLSVNLGFAVAAAGRGTRIFSESPPAVVLVVGSAIGAVVVGAAPETVVAAAAVLVGIALGAPILTGISIGIWLHSLAIRFVSMLHHPIAGLISLTGNWHRIMLTEDFPHAPELLPGVTQTRSTYRFDGLLSKFRGDAVAQFIALVLVFPMFLPTLLWRYSLKSTCWFYAPLILIAAPGKLADPELRRLRIDAAPDLSATLRFVASAFALAVAVVALVDWPFWRRLVAETEVFSPIGWLLVLDWGRFAVQPWQWFSLPGAVLTIVIYLWFDRLRKDRARLEMDGQDPETALGGIFSTEHHPGWTLYWLNRLRNALVVASLLTGFWYFMRGSYFAGELTQIEPCLRSIFGPR